MSRRIPDLASFLALCSRVLAATRSQDLLPSLTTGLVIGMINVIVAISLSALVFAGDLSVFVANGIGLFLVGGSTALIITGLLSSAPGTLTAAQDGPAAILAVIAASILRSLPASATLADKFLTVVAAVALCSLLTGLSFILLGHFKLGGLVRFLPYPVVGGFLAGTGWLLVTGGIGVMADVTFDFAHPGMLVDAGLWQRWLPGLILAIVMLLILNRYHHAVLFPGMLVGATLLFYLIMSWRGKSLVQLTTDHWLAGPFPPGGLWHPLPLANLRYVQWSAILVHGSELASILLISVVSLLLNASGIELVIKRDLDLNRELRAAGMGSVLSGLLGGLVCYHALTDTALNYRSSHGKRLTGWVAASFAVLPLFFGATLLSYVPKVVLGSLLVLLGLFFLWDWVYLAWSKFPRVEYVIILLILVISATVGYVQAVEVGLVAAVGLFAVNYSRVNVVWHAGSGAEFQSRVTRPLGQRQLLAERGGEIALLQLQGFLFFGTAYGLVERVRSRISQHELPPLRFVVLDFVQVTGIDSTAVLSFLKMKQITHDHNITLVITGLTPAIQHQLEHGGMFDHVEGGVVLLPDLDRGLEWCEELMLAAAGAVDESGQSWESQFGALLRSPRNAGALLAYLEPQEVEAGGYLMHARDRPDYLYFLTAGQLTAQLEQANGAVVRLETMRAGRIVGEVGFYLGQMRTAAVVADERSTVYYLSARSLARMEQEAPEVAAVFHHMIARLLAERVSHLIVVVGSLQRAP